MKKTIEVLNQMVSKQIIADYAIGGAVGLLFYTEPFVTYDLDIFCLTPPGSLSSISKFLTELGYRIQGQHAEIEGVETEFIVNLDDLTREATQKAVPAQVGNTLTRVFRYEYLLAILCKSRRKRDILRILEAIEREPPNATVLEDILRRHELVDSWGIIKSYGE